MSKPLIGRIMGRDCRRARLSELINDFPLMRCLWAYLKSVEALGGFWSNFH